MQQACAHTIQQCSSNRLVAELTMGWPAVMACQLWCYAAKHEVAKFIPSPCAESMR